MENANSGQESEKINTYNLLVIQTDPKVRYRYDVVKELEDRVFRSALKSESDRRNAKIQVDYVTSEEAENLIKTKRYEMVGPDRTFENMLRCYVDHDWINEHVNQQ
jgi:hypothetical protein